MFREVFAFTDSIADFQRKYETKALSRSVKRKKFDGDLLEKLSDQENKTKQINAFLRPPKTKVKNRKLNIKSQGEKLKSLISKVEGFRAQTECRLSDAQNAISDCRKKVGKLTFLETKRANLSPNKLLCSDIQIFKNAKVNLEKAMSFANRGVQTGEQQTFKNNIFQSDMMSPLFYQPSFKDIRNSEKNLCLLKKRRVIFSNFAALCQLKLQERQNKMNLTLELPETLFQTSSFIPILSPVTNVLCQASRELCISRPRQIIHRAFASQSTIAACFSNASDSLNPVRMVTSRHSSQTQALDYNSKLSTAELKCAKLTATIGVLMANFQSKQTALQKKIEAKKVDQEMHSAVVETNKRLIYKVEILEAKLEFFQFSDAKSQKGISESFEKINFELNALVTDLRAKMSKKKRKIETFKMQTIVDRKKFERLIEFVSLLWTEFFRQPPQRIADLCDTDIKIDEFNVKMEQIEETARSVMNDVLELKNYENAAESNQDANCKEVALNTLLVEFLHRLDRVVAQELKLKQLVSEQVSSKGKVETEDQGFTVRNTTFMGNS